VVAYGKSGRSGAALRGLRAAERLGGWASHTGTIETSTRMTATTLTTGAWFGRNRLLKIHIGRVGVPSQSESTWRNQRWKRTDPDGSSCTAYWICDPPCRSNGSPWPSMRPWLERWPRAVTGLGTDALTGQHGLIGR
jgi:hypothetical protein